MEKSAEKEKRAIGVVLFIYSSTFQWKYPTVIALQDLWCVCGGWIHCSEMAMLEAPCVVNTLILF